MNVPGSNLLNMALDVISPTPVNLFAFQGVTQNAAGMDQVTYSAAQLIKRGSVQAIDRNKYSMMGLDFEKSYVNWFVPRQFVNDVARDNPGDVIEPGAMVNGSFVPQGRRYQISGSNNWFNIDGWMALVCVDIGPATGALTNA